MQESKNMIEEKPARAEKPSKSENPRTGKQEMDTLSEMRIPESCATCLYDRQKERTDNAAYLAEVKSLIDNRSKDDTSPYIVYQINQIHKRYFGQEADYSEIKKTYNDLVLGMEEKLREQIEAAPDPVAKALIMARIGNYIDFGAMNHVDKDTFLALFDETEMRKEDRLAYEAFLKECEKAESFLLICDNCGEIVLDKLLIEQLAKRYPRIKFSAMVRGGNVLNDVTMEDAEYVGLDRVAKIISNGVDAAGTIKQLISKEAIDAIDRADVILAKGMGNYESMTGEGYHAFYAFLCKCDLFIRRFQVPRLTGIFVEEGATGQ